MLRFLLQRPIAVIMALIAALSLSILAFYKLPVSLLPPIDVPEITITVLYTNGSPEEIEQNILKPIRESVLTLNGLKNSESIAHSETGKVSLRFEYETQMDLAYIEVNEKIDRLTSILPKDLERPLVIKSSTSDIPIVRIQVIPSVENDMISLSELSTKVLKRRLEQIEGVGLVDINGIQKSIIRVSPDYASLRSLNLTVLDIARSIKETNLDLGSLSVKDGNYRYFLKLSSRLNSPKEIEQLPIILPDAAGTIRLKQVASVDYEPEKPHGFHLFGTAQSIVITVHKQAQARLPELMPVLYEAVEQFKKDYPQLDFRTTQDQSLLLTLSIQNLSQALVLGGAFAFAVLFLFMRGWREPLIMGIVLPISLILAFSIFYLFGLSLNIISLSGLALGLGMLVDNSIVVIDNIMLKRKEGENVLDSCVVGTQEVIVPLLSSALTNLAVFVPLIFLSGLTGALFYDQAISVGAILFVSILCTFIFVPLLYMIFFRNKSMEQQEDSRFFLAMKKGYEYSFQYVWKHKKISLLLMSMLLLIGAILLLVIPKQGFPDLERTETVISIDWNEPIDAKECRNRVVSLLNDNTASIKLAEAEIGYQQFMLSNQKHSVQHAQIYLAYTSQKQKEAADKTLKRYLSERFPIATIEFMPAPNAFEQIFSSSQPFFEARFRNAKSKKPISIELTDSLIYQIKSQYPIELGKGFETETMVFLQVDFNRIKNYQISYNSLIERLKIAFGEYLITDFKNFGEVTPVVFNQQPGDFETAIRNLEVTSENGSNYPVSEFVTFSLRENFKNITSDASGIYQSVNLDNLENEKKTESDFSSFAISQSLMVDFEGRLFENKKNFNQLVLILIVSLLLMYFILTAEFESLTQPLMVMVTIPMGFAGSLILLWSMGGSLNIMSGIGLVVVLGILDNDAILKIDRINRLREHLPLEKAIKQAGLDRLKPIVMNTCTNVLAITPILFSTGLGADLQRPIAITTIGGLLVGTMTALYFVPLMYWYLNKGKT
jgi:multidrug efflux pump subunit AcrB